MSHKQPDNVRQLRGNPGNTPDAKATFSTTGTPKPPLNLRGEAFAEWVRVTSYLASIGQIEQIDYAALVVYCTAWATYERAREAMEQLGPLIEGRDGGLVKNPAAQIMRDQSDTMLKYGAKFGFTPKDRVNLGIKNEKPDDDEFNGMLSGSA